MFGFLKKKIKEVFGKTKQELEKQTDKEEKEIKKEIKGLEKKEKKEPEKKEKLEEKKENLLTKLMKIAKVAKIKEENFDKFFSELEMVLIENNVAMEAIEFLKTELKKELIGKEIKRKELEKEIENSLKKAINELLIEPFDFVEKIKERVKKEKPYTIVFFGINGSGKTTTIAKISHLLKKQGLSSVLAASDTFRAASIEQLEKHAVKLDVKVIKHKYGSDPAAVAFDAIAHAKAQGIDCVLIDTAGRIHVKADLMREMEKIIRVNKPDLKVFVGEAIVGNDAIDQAKAFHEAIGIDAIILTKADVDEKGGAMISVSYVTKKPIIFLGVGQEYGDLKKFDKDDLIKSIFT
ncbi:MAG: signal recognition particle-docking protein FtsY [Candidatus Pacearchaeota archaeon]|nr:MAG: signal recognition particle-docking protein FtsY [Candidatus Pacearchaeota archaeon]